MSLGSNAALAQRQAEYIEEQRAEAARSVPVAAVAEISTPGPLTFWKVAFAVFVGNLMFAIVAGVIYLIAHS
jgi:hypothetical protein